MKQSTWMRPVLACLIVAALGVAACQTPTEYEVPVGQHLQFYLTDAAKDDDIAPGLQPLLEFCESWPGVENVWVNEQQADDGPVQVDVSVWGQSLDGDALLAALIQEFTWLEDTDVSLEPMTGTVEGSLADRIGHVLFDFEVDGSTTEEIRDQILAQMAAQGFDGDAVVEVQVQDGQQTVTIEVTGDPADAEGAVESVEDVFIIEQDAD